MTYLCRQLSHIKSKSVSASERIYKKKSSSTNAALIVSEAQNEATYLKEDLHLVTLDAAKAYGKETNVIVIAGLFTVINCFIK